MIKAEHIRARFVLAASCLLALPAMFALVASTRAAQGLSISPAGQAAFPERAFALEVPEGIPLELGDLSVRENGDPVQDIRTISASEAAEGEFASVLVIDASNSMAGRPIKDAMEAAKAFADQRALEQQLAILTFNNEVSTLVDFTTDDAAIAAALAETPRVGKRSRVFDATNEAIEMLEEADIEAGSVVILSDGADNGSSATAVSVAAHASSSGVRTFVIGYESSSFDRARIEPLAVAGEYTDADGAGLSEVFDEFGARFASEYLVRYSSAAKPGEVVTVEVTIAGVPGVARATYTVPRGEVAQLVSESGGGFWGATGTMLVIAALMALLIVFALIVLVRPQTEGPVGLIGQFVGLGRAPRGLPAFEREGHGPLLDRLEDSLSTRAWWSRFNEELEIAKIEIPAVRIVAGTAFATLIMLILIAAITSPVLAFLAFGIPLIVRSQINRRLRAEREKFAEQLADNLQVVASAVRGGQSFVGALSVVVEEADEPARGEFRRIVRDEQLGVPLENAVREVARRMDSADMEQVALVAQIQREVGGNTAEVLDRVIETIRERAEIRRLVNTLTAQGRLSRTVVSLIPVFLLVIITAINPEYMEPLYTETLGNALLALAALLVAAGYFVIKRIVDVEV